MIRLGPYAFTQQDARRTLDNFPPVFALFAEGRDARVLDGLEPTFTGDLETDLAAAWTAMTSAGPLLRAAGQLPAPAAGTVTGLHLGDGGVPKRAVDGVEVDFAGVVGDRQATRYHHGRPWQALCIWSSEVVTAFATDGHPIFPGACGENIDLGGLPWAEVRAGVRLRIGTVLCEVSCYALPCKQNARWFLGRDFNTMHHERGPVSRVYATVLEPGFVRVGDAAMLEP